MQLQMVQFMDLYPNVIHDAQSANAFDQLFFFQCMRRANHHMHFYSAGCCPDDAFNDHEILVSFVLNKKRMLCLIDEPCYSCPAINATPDKTGVFAGIKICSCPVGLKT